jgi:hypothetical protein
MPDSPRDWISETISDSHPNWGDLMEWARHKWGRSAARKVAESAGVSPRTGRRWLASSTAPKSAGAQRTKAGAIGQGAQRQAAANKARKARKVIAGVVQVWEISRHRANQARLDGFDLNIHGIMGRVADLIEAGNDDEAATLMSGATITAYGGDYVAADWREEEGLAAALEVTEWTDGFDLK